MDKWEPLPVMVSVCPLRTNVGSESLRRSQILISLSIPPL